MEEAGGTKSPLDPASSGLTSPGSVWDQAGLEATILKPSPGSPGLEEKLAVMSSEPSDGLA